MTKRDEAIALWDAGLRDFSEIAERIGATQSTVRGYTSRAGRHKRYQTRAQPGTGSVQIPIPRGFADEAARRGLSSRVLAMRILNVVAKDNLYRGVLDD